MIIFDNRFIDVSSFKIIHPNDSFTFAFIKEDRYYLFQMLKNQIKQLKSKRIDVFFQKCIEFLINKGIISLEQSRNPKIIQEIFQDTEILKLASQHIEPYMDVLSNLESEGNINLKKYSQIHIALSRIRNEFGRDSSEFQNTLSYLLQQNMKADLENYIVYITELDLGAWLNYLTKKYRDQGKIGEFNTGIEINSQRELRASLLINDLQNWFNDDATRTKPFPVKLSKLIELDLVGWLDTVLKYNNIEKFPLDRETRVSLARSGYASQLVFGRMFYYGNYLVNHTENLGEFSTIYQGQTDPLSTSNKNPSTLTEGYRIWLNEFTPFLKLIPKGFSYKNVPIPNIGFQLILNQYNKEGFEARLSYFVQIGLVEESVLGNFEKIWQEFSHQAISKLNELYLSNKRITTQINDHAIFVKSFWNEISGLEDFICKNQFTDVFYPDLSTKAQEAIIIYNKYADNFVSYWRYRDTYKARSSMPPLISTEMQLDHYKMTYGFEIEGSYIRNTEWNLKTLGLIYQWQSAPIKLYSELSEVFGQSCLQNEDFASEIVKYQVINNPDKILSNHLADTSLTLEEYLGNSELNLRYNWYSRIQPGYIGKTQTFKIKLVSQSGDHTENSWVQGEDEWVAVSLVTNPSDSLLVVEQPDYYKIVLQKVLKDTIIPFSKLFKAGLRGKIYYLMKCDSTNPFHRTTGKTFRNDLWKIYPGIIITSIEFDDGLKAHRPWYINNKLMGAILDIEQGRCGINVVDSVKTQQKWLNLRHLYEELRLDLLYQSSTLTQQELELANNLFSYCKFDGKYVHYRSLANDLLLENSFSLHVHKIGWERPVLNRAQFSILTAVEKSTPFLTCEIDVGQDIIKTPDQMSPLEIRKFLKKIVHQELTDNQDSPLFSELLLQYYTDNKASFQDWANNHLDLVSNTNHEFDELKSDHWVKLAEDTMIYLGFNPENNELEPISLEIPMFILKQDSRSDWGVFKHVYNGKLMQFYRSTIDMSSHYQAFDTSSNLQYMSEKYDLPLSPFQFL